MDPDEKQLLARLRNGDKTAAVAIIERSYAPIYGFLRSGQVGPDTPPIELRLEKRDGQWKFAPAP